MSVHERWVIDSIPTASLTQEHFVWETSQPAPLGDGEVRVATLYISLDPTNRVWFLDESYLPPLAKGDVMRAAGLGEVVESNNDAFPVGTRVQGLLGWQNLYTSDGSDLLVLPDLPGVPLSAHFGLLGHIGLAAYYGICSIGKVQEGETVLISAGAGAVGVLAGQIAKNLGADVVGVVGSDVKRDLLTSEYRFDAAVNYKQADFTARLADATPNGVDLYFDNVGGMILDTAIGRLNDFSRIVACGMIAEYNLPEERHVFMNLSQLVSKRVHLQGFIVLDHLEIADQAYAQMLTWHAEGRLKYRLDVVEGLRGVPAALQRLFDGSNTGKLVAEIGHVSDLH